MFCVQELGEAAKAQQCFIFPQVSAEPQTVPRKTFSLRLSRYPLSWCFFNWLPQIVTCQCPTSRWTM